VPVDSLQKQEEGRDARGRFRKVQPSHHPSRTSHRMPAYSASVRLRSEDGLVNRDAGGAVS